MIQVETAVASKTFKQFVAESNAQTRVRGVVRQLLKTDQYTQRGSIDEKMLDKAKSVDHKFIDTPAGAWVAELLQTDNQQFVEVSPPKGMEVPCIYFIKNSKELDDEIEDVAAEIEESVFEAVRGSRHTNVIGKTYSSKKFHWNKGSKTFSAEASELGDGFDKQLWNDSADQGFGIKSEKTGDVVLFTLHKELRGPRPELELFGWEFHVVNSKNDPALRGLKAVIYND